MRRMAAILMALCVASPAVAQPVSPAALPAVAPLPADANPRPVAFARVGSSLRDGQRIGVYLYGAVCIQPVGVTWGDFAKGFVDLKDVFASELKSAGFKPDVDPANLFADQSAGADLQVGAMVKGADVSVCEGMLSTSGKVSLDVDWQIYSSLRREVVATIPTHVDIRQQIKSKAARNIAQEAFAASVRSLLSDDRFRTLVTSADPSLAGSASTAPAAPIVLAGASPQAIRIADAAGSVVAIFAGSSLGSGVLVSGDGHFLTAQHVVGDATTVKIRWSDGFESTAQVVRRDKRRDVALLKGDARGRTPLAVDRKAGEQGSQVYAIGTPLDPKLQNTVTRGIISGRRIMDGFSFLQSDVAVTHGNSGGPLLNERGAVIGLADLVFRPDGQNESLNFFIPVGDALDFLQLRSAP